MTKPLTHFLLVLIFATHGMSCQGMLGLDESVWIADKDGIAIVSLHANFTSLVRYEVKLSEENSTWIHVLRQIYLPAFKI